MLPSPDDLIETFSALDDWESRYGYLIDLGRDVPAMDDALKTDDILVKGCTSRVWLVVEKRPGLDGQEAVFHFQIDSDAAIVKGLCAVLMVFVQDRRGDDIAQLDMDSIFTRLHLADHLSPNRRNGFFAMVERVKQLSRG